MRNQVGNAILCLFAVSSSSPSQVQSIPVRHTARLAATTDRVGLAVNVREIANGLVLINDLSRRRLILLDSMMQLSGVLLDSVSGTSPPYPTRPRAMIRSGASTLIVDPESSVLLTVNPDGTLGRTIAPPKPRDLSAPTQIGTDRSGSLIYRVNRRAPTAPGSSSVVFLDSAALVRASFGTGRIDTIAKLRISVPSQIVFGEGPGGQPTGAMRVNPSSVAVDDWTVTSDGVVAIVRGVDYSIEWIDADRTVKTQRMPFAWRRITDDDKLARIDSARKVFDSLAATGRPYGWTMRVNAAGKTDTIIPTISFAPLTEMADYVPPVRPGTTLADENGNVWTLPVTSSIAGGGLVYDVINRAGQIVERVQVPPGRQIVGFGAADVLYLAVRDTGPATALERVRIVR